MSIFVKHDIFVDASGSGKIGITNKANIVESLQSGIKTENNSFYEFEAICFALWKYKGHQITSDSKSAIDKAEKLFGIKIKWIKGDDNPADKYTKIIKPAKVKSPRKIKSSKFRIKLRYRDYKPSEIVKIHYQNTELSILKKNVKYLHLKQKELDDLDSILVKIGNVPKIDL